MLALGALGKLLALGIRKCGFSIITAVTVISAELR